MKNVFAMILVVGFLFSMETFAQGGSTGVGSGPSATPNLQSKMRIQAVLNEVNGISQEILAIVKSEGHYYVNIRHNNCDKTEVYKIVTSGSGPRVTLKAKLVSKKTFSCD